MALVGCPGSRTARGVSASSSAFSSMFKSGFRESDGRSGAITIPNISYEIFELMMRCVYTGRATIADEHAPALLKVADQYLLEGLKLQCERELAEKQQLVEADVTTLESHAAALGSLCPDRCLVYPPRRTV